MAHIPMFDTRLTLEARDASRNIQRSYVIERSSDLFGRTIISLSWGRIGRRHRSRVQAFDDDVAAGRFVMSVLSRRSSAHKRLGVPYRVVSVL